MKVKEVAPYATKSSLRKFWQEDLALTRLYNLEHGDTEYFVFYSAPIVIFMCELIPCFLCSIKEGIVNDLNKVDNQEEIHRALNMDPLIKKINTKVGGAGEIAVLDDVSVVHLLVHFTSSDLNEPFRYVVEIILKSCCPR